MEQEKSFSELLLSTPYLSRPSLKIWTDILNKIPEWSDITDDAVKKYHETLLGQKGNPSVRIGKMKTFLSKHEGLFPSQNYKEILYRKQSHRCNSFALTREQAYKVMQYKPENNEEGFVWRMFVIQMLTGAQYEDAIKFNEENQSFAGNRLYYERKDGTDISIALHPLVKELLPVKYEVTPTFAKRFGQYTKTLREVFRKLEIEGTFTNNGVTGQIHDVITPNVALHTYATIQYNDGTDVHKIMEYMGFKTLKALYHHIPNYQKRKKKNADKSGIIL